MALFTGLVGVVTGLGVAKLLLAPLGDRAGVDPFASNAPHVQWGYTAQVNGKTIKAGETFRDCDDCPQMALIPPGSYRLPSSYLETHASNPFAALIVNARPLRDPSPIRKISRPFAIGVYEVTRRQFQRFVDETGYNTGPGCQGVGQPQKGNGFLPIVFDLSLDWKNPGFGQTDEHPVVCVDWNDAKAYANWLSMKTGRHYRLPHEHEWEYGTVIEKPSGSGREEYRLRMTSLAESLGEQESDFACDYANGQDADLPKKLDGMRLFSAFAIYPCSDGHVHTAPVGSLKPNGIGLYDVIGNVWEWTRSCNSSLTALREEHDYWDSRAGFGANCNARIIRGGGWAGTHINSELNQNRDFLHYWKKNTWTGFRVVRSFESEKSIEMFGAVSGAPELAQVLMVQPKSRMWISSPTVVGLYGSLALDDLPAEGLLGVLQHGDPIQVSESFPISTGNRLMDRYLPKKRWVWTKDGRYGFVHARNLSSEAPLARPNSDSVPSPYHSGEILKDCEGCPETVVIPTGQFLMGSGQVPSTPIHEVSIEYPFAMGREEITRGQWKQCVLDKGCSAEPLTQWKEDTDAKPIRVPWAEAKKFTQWLSERTNAVYRLPSSTEWEYAVLGQISSDGQQEKKGGKRVNPYKLTGIGAGLNEWTEDCAHPTFAETIAGEPGKPTDGSPRLNGFCHLRVVRDDARTGKNPNLIRTKHKSDYTGFRLIRDLVVK